MVLGVRSSYRPEPRPPVEMAWAQERRPGLLVVDSDVGFRTDLAAGLVSEGWCVWTASDGPSGLELYRAHADRIDAVLVDLQLPGLQGAQTLAELGELNPDLICCAISACSSPYVAAAFRRMSPVTLFPKPLAIRALAFTLYEMVNPVVRH